MTWNWTASPIQGAAVAASAMLLAGIGLFGLLRRGHWLTTLLFASCLLSLAAFQDLETCGVRHQTHRH